MKLNENINGKPGFRRADINSGRLKTNLITVPPSYKGSYKTTIVCLSIQDPLNKGTREHGPAHFFRNCNLLGIFYWKFTFMSFSKASITFVAQALPESRRLPWVPQFDIFLRNGLFLLIFNTMVDNFNI